MQDPTIDEEEYAKKYGFKSNVEYIYKPEKGLSERIIRAISNEKHEPEWMLEKRLEAYKIYREKPMPRWGIDLSRIDFEDFYYYLKPTEKKANSWEEVPEEIKDAFEKLGVPEAERKFFAGTEAQFDSEVIYGNVKKTLSEQGVIFTDIDSALKEYPEIVKKYFGSVIAPSDNKFAALNTAVWSGGSFVYVPKGVKVRLPLQAYFRINSYEFGQFERTLIIADEGSDVTYLEGCTAPIYTKSSLHAAVVEVIAKEGAHVRYVTVQNWSKNVYNLVTQRAHAEKNARLEWIDVNLGGRGNMKYPAVLLKGENASAEILSVSLAGNGQVQDTGGKLYHLAPNTKSKFISKSVSSGDGNTIARFLVHIGKEAANAAVYTKCDAMLIDEDSKASTFPYLENRRSDALQAHEASIGKISKEAVEYIMSRGISEDDAKAMVIFGFINDLVQGLPMDYLLELRRLVKLNIERKVA